MNGSVKSRLLSATLLAMCACGAQSGATLDSQDVEAVRVLERSYVSAWVRNDRAAVMGTLAPGAVLMPSRQEPIEGHEAIRDFWFPPDSPPWAVTAYETEIDEIEGSGNLAYARGRGDLTFVWDGQETRTESVFMMVARQGEDGRWRIARRIWTDLRD